LRPLAAGANGASARSATYVRKVLGVWMLDFGSVPPKSDFVPNWRAWLDRRWINRSSNLTLGVGIYNGGQRHARLDDV
jgi:hypothetical protein